MMMVTLLSADWKRPMPANRQKFSTRVNSETLAQVRKIAAEEGRQHQAVVDEALADLVEKRRQVRPRPHVVAACRGSLDKYDELHKLYKKLAK